MGLKKTIYEYIPKASILQVSMEGRRKRGALARVPSEAWGRARAENLSDAALFQPTSSSHSYFCSEAQISQLRRVPPEIRVSSLL